MVGLQQNGISRQMKTGLIYSRHSLPEKTRIEVAALLQERLADSINLMMQVKQAHWNVKGLNFIAMHELFDMVFNDTGRYVNVLAERIVQLGGIAQGPVLVVAKNSPPSGEAWDASSNKRHVAQLAHEISFYGELIRQGIDQANKLNDADTADILTEISRGADNNLWFVEAHEQIEH